MNGDLTGAETSSTWEVTVDRPVDPDRLVAAIAGLPRAVDRVNGRVHSTTGAPA